MKTKNGLIKLVAFVMFVLMVTLLFGCSSDKESSKDSRGKTIVRVGYFPNITHAQALVGLADGTFQKELGKDVEIKTYVFNAGPTAVEAMLAGELDLAYMGPVPAMNGAWRSNGSMQIIAGNSEAGAVLVVRKGSGIKNLQDLKGKKVAVPQLANTQDLTLRRLFVKEGLKSTDKGGDITVVPVENPDILALFQKDNLDAALVPEPWGSRLVQEGNGEILMDWNEVWEGGRYPTAVLVSSRDFLKQNPDLVKKWLKGQIDLTNRLNADKKAYKATINKKLKDITGKVLSDDILLSSLERVNFINRLEEKPLKEFLQASEDSGYTKGQPDLKGLMDDSLLQDLTKNSGK